MPLLSSDEIFERAREAAKISANCELCPRSCGVDRTSGELGFCSCRSATGGGFHFTAFWRGAPFDRNRGGWDRFLFRLQHAMRLLPKSSDQPRRDRDIPMSPQRLAQEMLGLQKNGLLQFGAGLSESSFAGPSGGRFSRRLKAA